MNRGLDTNVLVYAHVASLPEHRAVRSFLERQLSDPGVNLVLTAGVLHEFVHVVTDARRFDPPVAIAEATGLARLYLGRTNVSCVATDEAAMRMALDLVDRHHLGRRRLADALLAATLIVHDVPELVTTNLADYAVFAGLATIDPRGG